MKHYILSISFKNGSVAKLASNDIGDLQYLQSLYEYKYGSVSWIESETW